MRFKTQESQHHSVIRGAAFPRNADLRTVTGKTRPPEIKNHGSLRPALRHSIRILCALGKDLLEFAAPRCCEICGIQLSDVERPFESACTGCIDALPPAPPSAELLNRPVARAGVEATAIAGVNARFLLRRQDKSHALLHALKYHGCKRIGIEFGAELARTLSHLNFDDLDAIVPVPLHPARRRERGFNQAEEIARGVAQVLALPVFNDALRRRHYTASQTGLSAQKRQDRGRRNFLAGPEIGSLLNAHVLLVDDVFTTGATANACAQTLAEKGVRRIEVATLAAAE